MARYVKGVVARIPGEKNLPAIQLERELSLINDTVEENVRKRLNQDHGVNVVSVDIGIIDFDKTSPSFLQLERLSKEITVGVAYAAAEAEAANLRDMQAINAENTRETMRIQREEAQYAQRKQTQTANLSAFQMEKQAEVGIAGAEALGKYSTAVNNTTNGGAGFDPISFMSQMAMGGMIAQNVAETMGNAMDGLNQQDNSQSIPPLPNASYHVAMNGQVAGPFDIHQLTQMAAAGMIQPDTLVWTSGLPNWMKAETVKELSDLFTKKESLERSIPPLPEI